jgi:hypothetical protein
MRTFQIRFTTLAKKFGPVQRADRMTNPAWNAAVAERRFATLYHNDNGDWGTPVIGLVAHHGCCNAICKIAWAKPLPRHITEIIGLRNSDEAFALCNPN